MPEHQHARPVRPLNWPVTSKTPAQYRFDLLAEMAKDPANGLEQIEPGVYRASHEACPFCDGSTGGWLSGSC